jgi:hypothetical protein
LEDALQEVQASICDDGFVSLVSANGQSVKLKLQQSHFENQNIIEGETSGSRICLDIEDD